VEGAGCDGVAKSVGLFFWCQRMREEHSIAQSGDDYRLPAAD